MIIKTLLSPKIFYHWCYLLQPWILLLCLIMFIYGLTDGLLFVPPDYQQGDAFRIIYIHVPAAFMSLFIYAIMAISATIYLIWKIKIAEIIAKVSAPIGVLFTGLTLVVGSIWGKPTWGTFWIWDARLTSELILLFIYFGIIAIRSAIPEPTLAAKASSVITLIGLVNIPIIHFSVDWWHTLHQGPTLFKLGRPAIAANMMWPLLAMMAAFFLYYVWVMMIKIRIELIKREKNTAWVKLIIKG